MRSIVDTELRDLSLLFRNCGRQGGEVRFFLDFFDLEVSATSTRELERAVTTLGPRWASPAASRSRRSRCG